MKKWGRDLSLFSWVLFPCVPLPRFSLHTRAVVWYDTAWQREGYSPAQTKEQNRRTTMRQGMKHKNLKRMQEWESLQ